MEGYKQDKKKIDWKPAAVLFTQISTWVVAPIVLALIFGKMLDARYGTRPIIFLVFAGLGFLVTSFGIVRVVKKYVEEIKRISPPSDKAMEDVKQK